MKPLFLKSVAITGRYFALIPFLISLLIGYGWLALLDYSLIWFVVSGVVAGPIILASVSLLLGMLFSGTAPNASIGVTRDEASEFWALIEGEFNDGTRRSIRVYVNESLSASVYESRSAFGLFGTTVHLDFGVPLLAVLDVQAFRAVVSHEYAHVKFKDTNGSRNTAEFFNCFDFLFDFMPPGETVTGTVVAFLFSDLSAIVRKEQMRLSRKAELRADRYASEQGETNSIARSLRIVGTASSFMKLEIVEPLEKEILRSASLPTSPYLRFMKRATELDAAAEMDEFWQKALNERQERDSSHPDIGERLAVLGHQPTSRFEPVGKSAWQQLIPAKLQNEICEEFESDWQTEMENLYS